MKKILLLPLFLTVFVCLYFSHDASAFQAFSLPNEMSYDSAKGEVFVVNTGSFANNSLSVLSDSTYTVTAPIPVGVHPESVAYDSAKGEIFLTNGDPHSNSVSVISDSTNTVVATIPIGASSYGVAYDPAKGEVFVANTNNSVSVISDSTNKVVKTITVKYPVGIAYDPAKGEMFVTGYGNGIVSSISVINDTTNTVVATITVGGNAESMAYDSAKKEMFVANYYSNSVSVINDTTNTVVATIPVGTYPIGVAYDSAKGEVFVANELSNFISVISDKTNSVVATIQVDSSLWGVAYDPAKGEMFIANAGSNSVSIFSDTTNTIIATIPGSLPYYTHELEIGDSNKNCEAITGVWNSITNTCTFIGGFTLTGGDSLKIDSGVTLQLNSGDRLSLAMGGIYNYGTINSGGIIEIDTSFVKSPLGIYNYGTINNSGDIANDDVITNFSGGTINNNASGTIENMATYEAASIYNSGTINNSGTITNDDQFTNNSGGTITNSGTITNDDQFTNNSGGTINNLGKINNNATDGVIYNSGNINNKNTIINSGDITNVGTITNSCGIITGNSWEGNPVNGCDFTKTAVSPNPSNVGLLDSIIFVGKVTDISTATATAPQGTLIWSDGGAGGTFSNSTMTTNKCTLSYPAISPTSCKIAYKPPPTAGIGSTITINATYSGEPTHKSSSDTSKLTVARATMTAISPSNATVVHRTKQVYNVTVTDTSLGAKTAPTGKVSWTASRPVGIFSSDMCTLVAISKSQSQCSVTYIAPLSAGSFSITAVYGGYGTHAYSFGVSKVKVT